MTRTGSSEAFESLLGRHWHHLPSSEVGQMLETNLDTGLDLFEVKHRHERFGPNRLTPRKGRSPWMRSAEAMARNSRAICG